MVESTGYRPKQDTLSGIGRQQLSVVRSMGGRGEDKFSFYRALLRPNASASLIREASKFYSQWRVLEHENRPEVFNLVVDLAVWQVRLGDPGLVQSLLQLVRRYIGNVNEATDRDAVRGRASGAFQGINRLDEARWFADDIEDTPKKFAAFLSLCRAALATQEPDYVLRELFTKAADAAGSLDNDDDKVDAYLKLAELGLGQRLADETPLILGNIVAEILARISR